MNKPIDKSKKSNIKCEHCKHCDRSNKDYDFCIISQTKGKCASTSPSEKQSLCDTCSHMFTCERSDVGISWANHSVCYEYAPVKNEKGGRE